MYGDAWFTIEQAEETTTHQTPFLHDKHLKKLTLVPAEKEGVIEVERSAGKRRGTFTPGTRMRFVSK